METRNKLLVDSMVGFFGMKCFSWGSSPLLNRRMQVASCKKWLEDVHGIAISPFTQTPFVLYSFSGEHKRDSR
jgi:hypothetical protein